MPGRPGAICGAQTDSTAISKRVEVKSSDGLSTGNYIPRVQAVREVQTYLADWDDPVKHNFIIRRPRAMQGKLYQWVPKQSGYAGPLVLQLV